MSSALKTCNAILCIKTLSRRINFTYIFTLTYFRNVSYPPMGNYRSFAGKSKTIIQNNHYFVNLQIALTFLFQHVACADFLLPIPFRLTLLSLLPAGRCRLSICIQMFCNSEGNSEVSKFRVTRATNYNSDA